MKLPSVIKVKWYIRYKNLAIELNRKNILSRDEYTCQYCSSLNGPLTIDHVKPRSPWRFRHLGKSCYGL